ncbi:MAG TPA: ferredoxin reductase family protein [Chloroflexota bacterium]|nr:ferredoxin reductase family protein [Chloroflexota bacterium]
MAELSATLEATPAATRHVSTRRGSRALSPIGLLLWFALGINTAVIIALWVGDGGISAIHTGGQLLTSLGRITGLLGGYFILIQVILLARLPWLERLVGFDRLTIWHRRNGKLSLYLVLAHTALITVGYALTSQLSISKEASVLLTLYPGMVSATIGTALMVVVVLSSIVVVRRRLRYEAWYGVHFMAYLAIGLAWIHQIPTGNDLAVNPTAASYWTALYLGTLGLLVAFRLVWPSIRNLQYSLRVEGVRPEGPGVVSLRLSGRHLERMHAKAGQFLLFRFLTRGRWWEAHPFSLSQCPADDHLRITVKAVGDFTRRMGEIRVGTRVLAEGPFGLFTGDVRSREKLLFIAGGIGITPIRSLLEEMNGDITLIYRVVGEADLIFKDELEALAARRRIDIRYAVGDHRDPESATLLSPQHLREMVPDIAEREVYLCGPPAMADLIKNNVLQAGTPREYIHCERFAL